MSGGGVRAMILGAGRGTRLRPLTETIPKVLVPVLGVPMLDRLLAGLSRRGVSEFALNTHHLSEVVRDHLDASTHRLPSPELFAEPDLLGTGGALVNASAFWGDSPLLVWNGDILCDVDPQALLAAHLAAGGAATLVVQDRPGDSHLLVDEAGWICGIDSPRRGLKRILRDPEGVLRPRAFNGISILDPTLRNVFPAAGAFDLIDALLGAMEAGSAVVAYDLGGPGAAPYGTTGSLAQLERLEAMLSKAPKLLGEWTPE